MKDAQISQSCACTVETGKGMTFAEKFLARKDYIYTALFLLGVVPYLNTLRNGFAYDDSDQVLNNPFILNSHHLWQIFTTPVWAFKTAAPSVAYFRPLMNLTFLGLHAIYGTQATGYHIFNLIISGWVVCALYAVTMRLTKNQPLALMSCVIFAMHPVHTEAVAWISDITDLELALFVLLAFWAYLALKESGIEWKQQLLIGLFFALALLSKEVAVVFPAVALCFEHFYREDRRLTTLRTKLARYGFLWAEMAAFMVYRRIVLGTNGMKNRRPEMNLYSVVLSGFQLFGQYVYKFLWPYKLQAFYLFHSSNGLLDVRVLWGIASFSLLVFFWLYWLRSRPLFSFGIAWFFAFIALGLNVRWLALAAFAERYLFLPSVGLCWICAAGALAVWKASSRASSQLRPALATAGVILFVLCFARIYTRNRDWLDSPTLFERTLEQDPSAYSMRNDVAIVYWNGGQRDIAVKYWEIVNQQAPLFYPPMVNLGMAAVMRGDWATAEKYLYHAAELWPKVSDSHEWLGVMREKQGRYDEAEKEMLKAEELSPYNISDYNDLAHLYTKEGRLDDAVKQMAKSAELMNDPISWDDLGTLYLKLGQDDNAEHAFRAALASNKYDSECHVGMGVVYEHRGNKAMAEQEYKLGLAKQPNSPAALAGIARLRQSQLN